MKQDWKKILHLRCLQLFFIINDEFDDSETDNS